MVTNISKMNHYKYLFLTPWYLFLLLAAGISTGASVTEARNHLYDIRYWSSPTFTRIVLDLKGGARYDSFSLKKPDRLVLDLKNFDGYVPKKLVRIDDGIVKRIRASRKSRGIVRIVIDLEKKSGHKIFPLKKISKKPPRLVVDITRPDLERAVRVKREKTRELKKKGDYIVVIDPGHGGEDPGAVGRKGTKEKDIVFDIAKKIVWKLNRRKGIKAYLTRKGDYFIPLRKRIEIAKQYGADLFISIHADSSFSKKTYGTSVYCLSFKGASSNAAQMAAKRENISDFIGGVPLDQQNNDLNVIIFDLVQTHSLNSSLQFAGLTLREVSKINRLHTKKPQQAEFAVLRAPDIPSILIETDFISNPRREKRMKTQWFKNEFANRVTAAVGKFLSESKGESVKPSRRYHVVKKGESLYSIAKRYKTTISKLRRLNGMSAKSTLRYGKKLRIL
jgi:N-acetylmuramoyl-L-alanine amidase